MADSVIEQIAALSDEDWAIREEAATMLGSFKDPRAVMPLTRALHDADRAVREAAIAWGLTMDPHQAWLVLRGIRTLGMRVERAQANAIEIAQWLEGHPLIEWVSYPGLASHRQYDLAKKQMSGPGSVLAFELRGGVDAGRILMNNVRVITLAVSLGGVESLIEHPASMTHKEGVTPGLVRLSVGCEDVDDLRADLAQALDVVKATVGVTAEAR